MEKMNARTQALARPMIWGDMPVFTAQNAQKKGNVIRMKEKMLRAARDLLNAGRRSEFLRRSVKKYGIGIAAALILWGWTAGACAIARNNAAQETEERLSTQYAVQLEQERTRWEQERMASTIVTGDASRRAQMEKDAETMARAGYGIRNIAATPDDIRTYFVGLYMRTQSAAFPASIYEVASQKNQFMGYDDGNPVLEDYYQIGLEVLELMESGHWPTTSDMVFAEWDSSGHIMLRNEYQATKTTLYWWWGK